MRQLLEYDSDPVDFEDTFCLRFTVTEEFYGQRRETALNQGGADMAVTFDNREEYVKLYCDYFVNKAIKRQFDAFQAGFKKVRQYDNY
jgi:hypothetical protein